MLTLQLEPPSAKPSISCPSTGPKVKLSVQPLVSTAHFALRKMKPLLSVPPRERLPGRALVEGLEEVHVRRGRGRHVDVGARDRAAAGCSGSCWPLMNTSPDEQARLVERQRRRVERLHARPVDVGVVVRARDVAVRERTARVERLDDEARGLLDARPGRATTAAGALVQHLLEARLAGGEHVEAARVHAPGGARRCPRACVVEDAEARPRSAISVAGCAARVSCSGPSVKKKTTLSPCQSAPGAYWMR